MEPRYPHFVLARKTDEVRYWAELEARAIRCATTYIVNMCRTPFRKSHAASLFAVSELIVAVIETFRHIRSR